MSGYELEVSEDQDFPPEKTTTIYQGNNTSYTASVPTYIPEETLYYFRVRGVSDTESSPWSNVVELKINLGNLPWLYAPVTEVEANKPFQLRYRSNSSTASTGWLREEYNSSDITIDIVAGTGEEEIALTREEPGIYKYTVSFPQGAVLVFSEPVYVTVLPAKQPVTLFVSSSEASYLEDYSFSWNTAGEVDGYQWQECAGDISNPLVTKVFPSQVLSWVCNHRVAAESTFLYRVRSFSLNPSAPPDTLFDEWSPPVQITVHPLQPPTGLAAVGATYGMTSDITWTAVAHADRYRLEMASGGTVNVIDTDATQISHTFLSLDELTLRVQAISRTDTSAWSSPVAVTVGRPPSPVAALSSDQVESNESYTLDWTVAFSAGLQAFIIEENTGGSSSELEIQPDQRSRTFSHEVLYATACTYRIKARYLIAGAILDTEWSAPLSITINPLPIATPDAPVAAISPSQIASGGSVTISWNAVANATSYELKNITDGTTTSVSGTSIAVTLVNDRQSTKTWQFTVTAVNEERDQVARSNASNTVSVEVAPLLIPAAPVAAISPSQIASGGSVTISWTAVANATSYELKNVTDNTTTSVSGTSIAITLVNDQESTKTWQFTVTALNEGSGQVARSGASNTVSVEVAPAPEPIATPDAPVASISHSQIESGESVTISWNAVANATSYELNNLTDGKTNTVSGTSRTVTLTNNQQSTKTWQFTVTAVNESDGQVERSGESNMVSVEVTPEEETPPVVTPAAPDLTIDDAVGSNSIVVFSGEPVTLRWNAVANATSYELTYYECDFNFDRISGPTTTRLSGTFKTYTFINNVMATMDHYEFTVTAINESGGQVARSSASNKTFVIVNWQ
ncbi:hypothetical protein ACFL4X_01740 [Gemmatimonadota bacterium]